MPYTEITYFFSECQPLNFVYEGRVDFLYFLGIKGKNKRPGYKFSDYDVTFDIWNLPPDDIPQDELGI